MGSVVFVTLTEAFVANQRREAALYRRYHSYYGYAFYIGRKRVDTEAGKLDRFSPWHRPILLALALLVW